MTAIPHRMSHQPRTGEGLVDDEEEEDEDGGRCGDDDDDDDDSGLGCRRKR